MANFCTQCGGKIEAGQLKCSFCGKDVSNLPAGNPTMQYGSPNSSQNTASSQSDNQSSVDNQYVSQNTVNQYSTQGTDNQYSQSTTNQYTSQNVGNPYSNYQDNTASYAAYQPIVPPEVPQSQSANGLQITGLVLGIISILVCCCPGGGIVLAVAGLVCSIIGNQQNQHGVGTAGLICSIVGIVFGVIGTLLTFLVGIS